MAGEPTQRLEARNILFWPSGDATASIVAKWYWWPEFQEKLLRMC
jgi:hypothetical protein